MSSAARILPSIVLALGVLLVLVAGAVFYVGYTNTGTAWVLERIRTSVDANPASSVQWRTAEGTLLSGLEVRDFIFATTTETGPLEIRVASLSFSWQPLSLLKYAVVIDPVSIDGLRYTAEGTASDSPPMTAEELQGSLFGLPVSIELRNVTARDIAWSVNGSGAAIDSLTGSAALDGEDLQLTGIRMQQGPTEVTGNVRIEQSLAADANIAWQTLVGARQYGGELTIGGALQRLLLEHTLVQPVQINSSGELVPGFLAGPGFGLDLRHSFTELDLAPFGQEGIVLRDGNVVSAGTPDALAITGVLQADVRELDLLTLNADMTYRPESLEFNLLQLDSSQVAMTADGALQFDPQALQLSWRVSKLDPGAALPQVRLADVSGEGQVTTSSTDEGIRMMLSVRSLEGLFNELPLAVSGMAEVHNAQLSAVELQARTGSNSLGVTGSATDVLALDWMLQAPQLGQLWQGLEGALEGQGNISGTLELPQVNGELNGRQLSLERDGSTVSVQSLQLIAEASAAANDIRLRLGPVSMRSAAGAVQSILEQASLTLAGTPAQHALNADITSTQADIAFALAGGIDSRNWRGSLQDSNITGSYGNWQQENAVAIAYEDEALVVDESCWTYVTVRLCLQAGRPANAGMSANLQLRNVPLAWLDVPAAVASRTPTPKPAALQQLQDAHGIILPLGLQVDGDLDLDVALVNFVGGGWDSLDATVVPQDVVLQVDFAAGANGGEVNEAVVERFSVDATTLHASNSADSWTAQIDLDVSKQTANGVTPQGDFSAQLSLSGTDELGGDVTFSFTDLGWIGALAPAVSEPYGSFEGRVTLAGTTSAPSLRGQLQLARAGFALPDYGLIVSDIDLRLQNRANGEFVLEGGAKSGDGLIAITTTFSNLSSADRSVKAEITGTDFSAINTSYARANISPQLQLDFANGELSISGGIILPLLDLDIEAMFASAGPDGVDVSRDVVVINATEEDAVATNARTVAIPLHANVTLLLGEDVRLRGYGLDTRLDGELMLEQAPNRPALVYGELGIPEGSFEIYNQVLNAEDGRLMFFGNPANPVVDIRAFRETNDAEVGMLLSGNIRNMQGTLYSSPNLPEDEILALLITGKSFNNINDQDGNALLGAIANFGFERSDGLTSKVSSKLGFDSLTVEGGSTLEDSALGLGKYITPNLLMRYKVGLFDRQSALSINYNLTEHIKLQVETGISQSVDLSYTIETD